MRRFIAICISRLNLGLKEVYCLPIDIAMMALEDYARQAYDKSVEFNEWMRYLSWITYISSSAIKNSAKPKTPQAFVKLATDRYKKKPKKPKITPEEALAFYDKLDKNNGKHSAS